jgi:Tol biopolymer transport system component
VAIKRAVRADGRRIWPAIAADSHAEFYWRCRMVSGWTFDSLRQDTVHLDHKRQRSRNRDDPCTPDHEDILARGHSGPIHGVSWSPDGRYLACSDREQLQDPAAIFLINKETRERRRLTTPPEGTAGDSSPTFSGDGKKIAFVRTLTDGMTQLVLLLCNPMKRWFFRVRTVRSPA